MRASRRISRPVEHVTAATYFRMKPCYWCMPRGRVGLFVFLRRLAITTNARWSGFAFDKRVTSRVHSFFFYINNWRLSNVSFANFIIFIPDYFIFCSTFVSSSKRAWYFNFFFFFLKNNDEVICYDVIDIFWWISIRDKIIYVSTAIQRFFVLFQTLYISQYISEYLI